MSDPIRLLLGDAREAAKTIRDNSVDALVTDPPAGISFMGRDWDGNRGGRSHWVAEFALIFAECLRVLKPGGHGLVWALPRTSHWTACALEDAGFEIRDRVAHVFGSGFPKSHNIAMGIDKEFHGAADRGVKTSFAGKRNPDGGEWPAGGAWEPISPDAQKWNGWGSALKPAVEDWYLVRKPLAESSLARQVLATGTGGLNIDGCRVPTRDKLEFVHTSKTSRAGGGIMGTPSDARNGEIWTNTKGRFPAHLLLSHGPECAEHCAGDCPVKLIGEQSGESIGTDRPHNTQADTPTNLNAGRGACVGYGHADSGTAARYFMQFPYDPDRLTFKYHGKITTRDRGQGNNHSTVKPTDLMRYLITLITPPGGTVFDPFMGSGSTGKAALDLGHSFVGIERDPEYYAIAETRIKAASAQVGMF